MGKDALIKDLGTTFRHLKTSEFTGVNGSVVDAGPGRSFVAYIIETALNSTGAGTLTFKAHVPTLDTDEAVQPTTLQEVKKLNGVGNAATPYTEKPEDNVGFFPLDPVVFNAARYLQPISPESQTGKSIIFVSKPT